MTTASGDGWPPGTGAAPFEGDWAAWVRERLFDRRIVFLRGPLDEALAGQVAAELMTLDASGDGTVSLHVDSPGGPLEAAFTVMDTIDLLGVPVEVTCVGRAEGSAVGVVAVASRRRAAPHARFRLSLPEASIQGTATELQRWARHLEDQVARFVARLAEATGRPAEHVEADLALGRWLDAEEAAAYRIVDEVSKPRRPGRQGASGDDEGRPPLGFAPPPR